jgi:CRP-like cAMP-binding protein
MAHGNNPEDNAMQAMHVEAGATIFRTGDASVAVFVIESGEVAITVGDATAPIEVARLGAGELFGESGVLESRRRSATATAITAANLLVTDAETFFRAFGMDNDRALSLVKLLCRRLRSTTARGAHGEQSFSPGDDEEGANAAIRLLPGSERLSAEFNMAAVDVSRLPFQVGNRFGGETLPIASNHSCCIPARGETDLAAPHFEILRRGGLLGVRDLGSRQGTTVNGTTITRSTGEPFVALHRGENEVVAGRFSGPFRFVVRVRGP